MKFQFVCLAMTASSAVFAQQSNETLSRREAQSLILLYVKDKNPKATEREITATACPGALIVSRYFDAKNAERLPTNEVIKTIAEVGKSPDFDRAIYNCALHTNKKLDLADLKANVDKYEGTEVVVEGGGMFVAGNFFVKSSPGDTSPVIIDATHVSSEQKTKFVSRCGDVLNECYVVVIGVARKKLGMAAVTASLLLLNK